MNKEATGKVLVIADDGNWIPGVITGLEAANFIVMRQKSNPDRLVYLGIFVPSLVILDETISHSLDICYRYNTLHIPVILICKDKQQQNWNTALIEAGAEFYSTQKTGSRELVARVKAILRRY